MIKRLTNSISSDFGQSSIRTNENFRPSRSQTPCLQTPKESKKSFKIWEHTASVASDAPSRMQNTASRVSQCKRYFAGYQAFTLRIPSKRSVSPLTKNGEFKTSAGRTCNLNRIDPENLPTSN